MSPASLLRPRRTAPQLTPSTKSINEDPPGSKKETPANGMKKEKKSTTKMVKGTDKAMVRNEHKGKDKGKDKGKMKKNNERRNSQSSKVEEKSGKYRVDGRRNHKSHRGSQSSRTKSTSRSPDSVTNTTSQSFISPSVDISEHEIGSEELNKSLSLLEGIDPSCDDSSSGDYDSNDSDSHEYDTEDEEHHNASLHMLEEMLREDLHWSSSSKSSLQKSQIYASTSLPGHLTGLQDEKRLTKNKSSYPQKQEQASSNRSRDKGKPSSSMKRLSSSYSDFSSALQHFEMRRQLSGKLHQDPTWSANGDTETSISKSSHRLPPTNSTIRGHGNSRRSSLSNSATSCPTHEISKPGTNAKPTEKSSNQSGNIKPEDCLNDLLNSTTNNTKSKNNQVALYESVYATKIADGFFVTQTSKDFDDFSNEISSAVRRGDVKALQDHVQSGKSPHCCNKFKESIVHTIARRGNHEMLQCILDYERSIQNNSTSTTDTPSYLPESLCVLDDQYRTPLHDAAWTHNPNFTLVKMIIESCPDLLLVKDQRGFTPLAYVGRNQWETWCSFLRENKSILKPKFIQPTG